jgi:hypothetical protein
MTDGNRRKHMATITLNVEITEELYSKFYRAATDKKGKWRGSKQSAGKAFQTAVEGALLYFIDTLENPTLADQMIKALMM